MKKLLLFALIMGLGTMSFAQITVSVDSFIEPTGDIVLNKPSSIKILITNNGTAAILTGSALTFTLTLDNVEFQPLTHEVLSSDLLPADTFSFFISQTWAPSTTLGTHTLCVELTSSILNFVPSLNNDQNKKLCEDYEFIWPLGINTIISEISSIKMNDEVMTISVKNNGNQARIQLMSVTGQVVKTVHTSAAGQNFTQDINISDLTSGVYIVTIQNENGASVAQKVFIQ